MAGAGSPSALAPGFSVIAGAALVGAPSFFVSSCIRQIGQSPGTAEVTSGCMGQTYNTRASAERWSARRVATNAVTNAAAARAKSNSRTARIVLEDVGGLLTRHLSF